MKCPIFNFLPFLVPSEEVLEAERRRVREEYENEMEEIRNKYHSEQESKAKIQAEVHIFIFAIT